jgi:Rieske 2Fe-2S family protein
MTRMSASLMDPEAITRTLLPFGASRGLPREAYDSADVLRWELQHLFDGAWVCVGRADELAEPGCQRAIRAGGEGLLLVRDADDKVCGFSNVCRHRAHELVQIGESLKGPQIRCPYHGWAYDLSGRHRGGQGHAREDLVPLRVEVWRGFVFANVSGAAGPLREWLGALDELTADHQLDRLQIAATHTYELAANWKLVAENYHECYHCPQIHPQLCRVSPPSSGQNFDRPGAWVGGPMELMPHAETMALDGRSRGRMLPGLSAEQSRRVYYYGLLPNLLVSLHPDYVLTHRIEPVAPDRTRIECQWLFPPETLAQPDFSPAYAVDFWDVTNRQDWHAIESVQRGILSRGYIPGTFTPRERAVYEFVTRVARAYERGGWTRPEPPPRPGSRPLPAARA